MALSEEYLKSVSESQLKDRSYTPYELEKHERDSIEEIKKHLKLKKYKDKESIKDSLEYIENLANKMNIAINNEKKENKTTWELESDISELKKVFEELNKTLQVIEQKEVDSPTNNTRRKAGFRK